MPILSYKKQTGVADALKRKQDSKSCSSPQSHTLIFSFFHTTCKRYCHQCRTKAEDEIHFVIECPMYDDIRNELIFSNPNIPPSDKFIALFNSENKTLLYNLGLQYRKDSLTKVM